CDVRAGGATGGQLRCRLRHRVPGAHTGREAGARGVVPLPPVLRRDDGAVGPGQRGGARVGAAGRGAPLGRRDPREEPGRDQGAEALVQRRQRVDRGHREYRLRHAGSVPTRRRGARGSAGLRGEAKAGLLEVPLSWSGTAREPGTAQMGITQPYEWGAAELRELRKRTNADLPGLGNYANVRMRCSRASGTTQTYECGSRACSVTRRGTRSAPASAEPRPPGPPALRD